MNKHWWQKKAVIGLILFLCFGYLYAQEEELTTITITNARQTTYSKDEKSGEDSIVLEGAVQISVTKGKTVSEISADKVTYDRKTEMLFAEGNVEITTKSSSEGGEKTTASSLLMNTATLEGIFDDGRVVQTQSDALNLPSGSTLIVFSNIFGKSENNTIAFKNSSLTFCDAEDPHWHIDASRTWLLPGGEFAFFNALLYVGPVPVLYFPAFYYPKDELIFNPVFGTKEREGKYIQTTTYLIGRKGLSDSNKGGSDSKEGESASEESLKAVYNFLRPTELKEQERQGLILHNLDEKYSGDTSRYLKLTGDWYSHLGAMVGLEGNLKPKSGIFSQLDFFVDLGFSNTVFKKDNDYSPFSSKGEIYYDKSNFLGLELPFRYGANLNLTISKPFNFSLSLPVYSDPFFSSDFKNRNESMDWISYLLDLGNDNQEKSSGSSVTSLLWQMSASYSPKLPSFINPFISSLSASVNSSIRINNTTNSALDEDKRANNNDGWKDNTPERSFFYPDQITPVNASVSLRGTLLKWPLQKTGSTAKKTDYPVQLTKPDELKTASELEKERAEAEQKQKEQEALQEENSQENTENNIDIKTEKSAESEEKENPSVFELLDIKMPVLETAKASGVSVAGLSYNLGYSVNANLSTQISYSTQDKDGKRYLNTPEDFDWNKIRSNMYTLKLPVSVNSDLSYGGSFISLKNSLSYNPVWQKHPNTDGYSEKEKENLVKADYNAQVQTLTNTNSLSIKPFAYIPAFSDTGLSWNNTLSIYKKKFNGNIENPEWKTEWLDWDDPEKVTSHTLNFTIGVKELDSKYKQTLTFSSNLKPQVPKYSGSLALVFPLVTVNVSSSIYEKSKTDSTIQYSPLQQSATASLFNSKLKINESFSYVYNDNSEEKRHYAENLKLSLSYNQLSAALNFSYTYKYDLYTDVSKKPEGKQLGYNIRKEKEFTPYSASLSYSLPSKTYYQWFNRISWAPSLSTSVNYDFIKPTSSYFQISPSLNFNINNFFKLTFSASTRNSSIYWYFQNDGRFSNTDVYGNNFASRLVVDLLQSFGIYGDSGWLWEKGAVRSNRENSAFKLKSLNMNLSHELHDWAFNMNWKFEPKIVKNREGKNEYNFSPNISIGIVWNPMESIKSNLTYEYKDSEYENVWTLK